MNEKKLFDEIRAIVGRGLTQGEVDRINAALNGSGDYLVSESGIAEIKAHEGYRGATYPDPASGGEPFTGGYGTTLDENRQPFHRAGLVRDKGYWDNLFARDINEFALGVKAALGVAKSTQNQFDAMVSLAYNIGINAFRSSTLLKRHKAGEYKLAAEQFLVWNKAAGKVNQGLVNRRAKEKKLYETP